MFFPTLYAASQPCYPYLVANGHHIQFILGWLDAAEFPTVLHQTFAFSHETPLGNETKLQDCCGCGKTTYFLLLWLSHLFSALTFIPAALLISVLSNIYHLHFVQSYNRLTPGYISCTSFTVGCPPDLRVQHRANIWRSYRYWELRLLTG